MNLTLPSFRRWIIATAGSALLLSGCSSITISDPIEEPPAIQPTATPAVAVVPEGEAATAPRRPRATTTATATPLLSPTPSPTPHLYQVVQGDTLTVIAKRFKVTVEALLTANNLTNGDALQVGQTLIIPSASQIVEVEAQAGTPYPTVVASDGNPVYFVQVGDTISAIADAQGVSRDDLMAANGLRPDSQLTAGDTLVIPTGPYTPLPTATAVKSTPVPTIEVVLADATASPTAAASNPTVAPQPTTATSSYVVKEGDYAGAIARDTGVTMDALKAANPGVDLDRLQVGQTLVIPAAGAETTAPVASATIAITSTPTATPVPPVVITHVVGEGESLESVAKKYGVTVEVLKKRNPSATGDLTPEAVIEVELGTPTPTPPRLSVPIATPQGMKYQTPVLLAPVDSSVWVLSSESLPPMLIWTSVGILEPDEYYVVRLRALNTQGDLLWALSNWTQTANWRLDEQVTEKLDGPAIIRWDVVVMERTSAEGVEPITGTPLSSKSESYTIRITDTTR